MSDIYIPGINSRFNTEKIIEDLMKIERVPRDRVERRTENLRSEKSYWQDVGRRVSSLRTSSRFLYSFQNPFNDRAVISSDESVLSGTAGRSAVEQERAFTVKQTASADRFLSTPLAKDYRVQEGTYRFTIGEEEISVNFRGGSLSDFTDAVNRRGQDKLKASTITVERGTTSLLIESLVTGAEKKLGFSGTAESLALETGMVEKANDSRREIAVRRDTVLNPSGGALPASVSINESAAPGGNALTVAAGSSARIRLAEAVNANADYVISFEASTRVRAGQTQLPPPGPRIESSGSASYGGITIENDLSTAASPSWQPPAPVPRLDNMAVLKLGFSDGTEALLPALRDSENFNSYQFNLKDIASSKTVVSIDLVNNNTHRDFSIRNINIYDSTASGGFKPLNAVATARDAIVSMEGIEIKRPTNTIDDLIPGVTLTVKGASDRPVRLGVTPDREGIKDAIIEFVGNYNRLMAEINVLTRNDDRVIQELSYLDKEEQEDLRKKLGAFSSDTALLRLKSNMQNVMTSPHPISTDQETAMLAQIGIGTDVRRSGSSSGYDPSRLRGYMEIDEKALDAALANNLEMVRKLFGNNIGGDVVVDSGAAFAMESLARPLVEVGGVIAVKTGTLDSRISQDQRRIETIDRQLERKEDSLKRQYGQMEEAYGRMERTSSSLDNFSRRANSNNSNN